MFWLYFLASAFKGFSRQFDDTFVDKLNFHYTSFLLLVLAIVVTAKQFVGFPIQCWVPATFTDAMEQYTENFCWTQNTYFLPTNSEINKDITVRKANQICYYQWVPFILALQAFIVCLPCALWRTLNWHAGLDLRAVMEMSVSARSEILVIRQTQIGAIVNHLSSYLSFQQRKDQSSAAVTGSKVIPSVYQWPRSRGYFITLLYSVTKCFYAANSIVLLFLLNFLLRTDYSLFGIQMLSDLLNGRQWEESGHFPRVTLCDLTIREVGQTHRHTVQCVLVINLFSEKIFIFLWFYFALLSVINLADTIMVLSTSHRASQCRQFIAKYLLPLQLDSQFSGSPQVSTFFDDYLRWDGVFVLRRIESRAGELICSQVVQQLYERYAGGPLGDFDPFATSKSVQSATNNRRTPKTYRLLADSVVSTKSNSRSSKKLPKFRYQSVTGGGNKLDLNLMP